MSDAQSPLPSRVTDAVRLNGFNGAWMTAEGKKFTVVSSMVERLVIECRAKSRAQVMDWVAQRGFDVVTANPKIVRDRVTSIYRIVAERPARG